MTRMKDFNAPTNMSRRRFGQMLGLTGAIAMLPWKVEAQGGVQTLVFALPGLVGNFEPHTWVGFGDTVHVMDTVARGLTHMDFANPLPRPAIAESWTVSEDGTVYDFTIRDGLTFHDGTPIDAPAVLRTFQRMKDEDDPTRPELSFALDNLGGPNVDGFEAPDARTFRINLLQPDAAILGRLSRPDMVIISPTALEAHGKEIGLNFVSCGPYRISSVTPNERVVLEAFDGFYKGTPEIQRVVMQVIPEAVAQMTALAASDLNVTNLIPHSNVDRLEAMEGIRIEESAAFISAMLAMNCEAGPLADIRVRRAINLGIDREAVVREAFFGKAEVPGYITPAAEQGYAPEHQRHSEYDPDAARALLEEAGAMGAELSLISENSGFWPRLGQVVERSLNDLGLVVTTEYLDGGTFNGRLFDKTAHELAFLQRSAFFPDPDGRFSPLFQTGTAGADQITAQSGLPEQAQLDAMIIAANAEGDPERRTQLYVELNNFMADEMMPVAAVVNTFLPVAVTADLEGVNANALGTYRTFLEDARYAA
ncbi:MULTISPECIES: ABC transporter substrate-binding protein [unclassified Roseitalea]|uniref:ABC transporter substrate-binding protein n=1 Tax=unclassified Roseitalea TaxID=2639107 RepID=UPI00273E39AC|nr:MULTISPECIES: ABC transporter substrate-binding protein [unclassified Roseitalea]